MNRDEATLVRMCAWSCVVFIVLFALFWGVLGRNIPPYSPDLSADALAAIYRDHRNSLRIGFTVGAFSSTFLASWAIGIFRVMLAIEARHPRPTLILPYVQLIGGVLTALVPLFSCIFLLTAAFRPEQDPGITRMLFDLGWLTIDIGFGVTILQYVAFGVVAMRDTRERPLFPNWLAWLGILISFEFVVELIMPYFRSGPLSWSGLIAYWLPFFGPFAWMLLVTAYLLKATPQLVAEGETAPIAPADAAATATS